MNQNKTSQPLNILLVEDNEHDRLAFRRVFKKSQLSYVITECIRAEEALEQFRSNASQFDIIVTDYALPGMSGLNLCETIFEEGIPLPMVLLTGTGSEQLAVEAFADSLEIVPRTLAENAGLESIDILVGLRAAHEKEKGHLMGVGVFKGEIVNSYENGVVEPLKVKEQAMKSAAEVAAMILRIDDVIASSKSKEGAPPGGMPPGY